MIFSMVSNVIIRVSKASAGLLLVLSKILTTLILSLIINPVPLTFKTLAVILPGEEMEKVGPQIWLSGEEGIFASETKTVEERDVESWQSHERKVI